MNYISKFRIAIVALILAGGNLVPFSRAQNRGMSGMVIMVQDGGYLGIQMKDVTADSLTKYKLSSERGVIVSSIVKGSPAEKANFKEDDVILEFGGFPVWSTRQLERLVRETPAERKVEIAISRDGKRMTLTATIEKRDQSNAERRFEMLPNDGFGPGGRTFEFRTPEMPDRPGQTTAVPQRARLGISVQPLTDQLGEFLGVPGKKGVLVASVLEGSPSVGKLKSGDVIVSVDGKSVESPEELVGLIQSKSEGSVGLKVVRDKKEISVAVTLSAPEGKGYKL